MTLPELPEVEVSRLGLAPFVTGQVITDATFRVAKLRHALPAELRATLIGRRVERIVRRGKYLLFDCRHGDATGGARGAAAQDGW